MILTVGGDVTSKGAQEMFKALANVDKEFKDWKYVCKIWPSQCSNEWSLFRSSIPRTYGRVK